MGILYYGLFLVLFTGIFMMTTENSIIQVVFAAFQASFATRGGLEKGWLHFKSNL